VRDANAGDWLSVALAAARLQVSPRRVRKLLAAGELASEDVGGREPLDAAQVERRAARRSARPPTARRSPGCCSRCLTRIARKHLPLIAGLMAQVFADPRVSAGRARAAAAHGLEVGPGDDALGYVAESDLADLQAQYALEPDLNGQLELRAYEPQPAGTTPLAGMPLPVAAAVFDLLESDDVRLRRIARRWLACALPAAAVVGAGQ
jgi:hypothetical protein